MDKRLQALVLLLSIVYAGDVITTYLLDPNMGGFEQNPVVLWGSWPYAVGISIFFVAMLSLAWKWSLENEYLLWPRQKITGSYFYWMLMGPGSFERWAVVLARVMPIASIAMKAALMLNNLMFYYLLVAAPMQNVAIMTKFGMAGSTYAFQRSLFVFMLEFMVAIGLTTFFWELWKLVRENKGKMRGVTQPLLQAFPMLPKAKTAAKMAKAKKKTKSR